MMERVVGKFPYRRGAKNQGKYFKRGRLFWDPSSMAGQHVLTACKPLRSYMPDDPADPESWTALFDLMEKMLVLDPSRRVKLSSALTHNFFRPCRRRPRPFL
jgi:serine/threonine protein kinase